MTKRTMKIRWVLFFGVLVFQVHAYEANQYLSDQIEEQDLIPSNEDAAFLQEGAKEDPKLTKKSKEKNVHSLPGGSDKFLDDKSNQKGAFKQIGYTLPGTFSGADRYIEYSNADLVSTLEKQGKKGFGISYYMDNYEYSDANGTFNKVFKNDTAGSNSHQLGLIQLSFNRFWLRKWVDVGYGMNLGVGYNKGKGYFSQSTNEMSDVVFQLWTIPVDLAINLERSFFWSWIKLSISGGPSMMGLIQTRNDFGETENKKRRNQFSVGYFGAANMRFSLSKLSDKKAFKLYAAHSVSQCYLNLGARLHNYSNFQDEDVSISGVSFGLGFTFEYL